MPLLYGPDTSANASADHCCQQQRRGEQPDHEPGDRTHRRPCSDQTTTVLDNFDVAGRVTLEDNRSHDRRIAQLLDGREVFSGRRCVVAVRGDQQAHISIAHCHSFRVNAALGG